jgi:hypothetical protein
VIAIMVKKSLTLVKLFLCLWFSSIQNQIQAKELQKTPELSLFKNINLKRELCKQEIKKIEPKKLNEFDIYFYKIFVDSVSDQEWCEASCNHFLWHYEKERIADLLNKNNQFFDQEYLDEINPPKIIAPLIEQLFSNAVFKGNYIKFIKCFEEVECLSFLANHIALKIPLTSSEDVLLAIRLNNQKEVEKLTEQHSKLYSLIWPHLDDFFSAQHKNQLI